MTEPSKHQRRATGLRERLTEQREEAERLEEQYEAAQETASETEAAAIDAAALRAAGEGSKEDVQSARDAYEEARAEKKAVEEELKTTLRACELIEERLEEAEAAALQEEIQAHRALVASHVETVAELLNELGPAMQSLKAANEELASCIRQQEGRYANPPKVWDADLLPENRVGRAIGETLLSRWFKHAKGAGFDVELETGHWAEVG